MAPGDFYGPAGAEHVRIAITATDERVAAACSPAGSLSLSCLDQDAAGIGCAPLWPAPMRSRAGGAANIRTAEMLPIRMTECSWSLGDQHDPVAVDGTHLAA